MRLVMPFVSLLIRGIFRTGSIALLLMTGVAAADEPKPPAAPDSAPGSGGSVASLSPDSTPVATPRKFTPAEQAKLAEATALSIRLVELHAAGKSAEAIPLAEQALDIRKQVLGEMHPDYATSLHNLAGLYDAQGDYAKAEPLYRQSLTIRKQVLGVKHPDYAASLNNLGLLYQAQHNYAKAVPLLAEALPIHKLVFGEKHPYYVASVDNLAGLYKDQGNYAKAESLYLEALAIRKQVFGEKHPDYAHSLNCLALLYKDEGNYAKAEPLYLEALAIRRQTVGEKHPDYATVLDNLATLYRSQGNYAKAEPLMVEALAIYKQVLGEKDPDYAITLNNLALVYQVQGNYAKAEPLFVEALAIRKQLLGEKHAGYATSLNNLARLYLDQGFYTKAEPLFVEALAIRKRSLGEKHPEYAISLNDLGRLYSSQGNYAKAEPLFVEALAIRKQALGERHPDYAASLSELAHVYNAQRNYAKAEQLYVEALAIRKQVLGEKSSVYAGNLNALALLYDAQGNYAKAEPLLIEGAAIYKQAFGKNRDYASNLNNLACCEIGLRSFAAAAGHAHEAAAIMRQHLEQAATIQTEHQQLQMLNHERSVFSNFLSAGDAAQTPPESVYDEVLAWKGAVTSRQAFLKSLRRDLAKNPQAKQLYGELEAATSQLAVLTNRVPTIAERTIYKKRLDELSEQVEDLQEKLAKVSARFAEQRAQEKRTSAELRQALPADTALIDLIEYNHYGWTEKSRDKPIWRRRIAAFVVRRDQPVAWIDLGPSADIDSAVETWRADYGLRKEAQDAGATLRQRVWLPLEAHLTGTNTGLISPDGELAKFPWVALPGKTPGTFLIEERAIAVIPVPQALPELLAKKAVSDAAPSLLLVGDVDYGGDPGMLLASDPTQRAVRDGTTKWNSLPGTRAEILAIRDSFEQKFADGKTQQLRKEKATAAAVREAAPEYRYLHFATHGFFADPKIRSALKPSEKPESSIDRSAMLERATGEHPGLLSGIVLAGANRPAGDGILTALEVGELDLTGVDLATLSACETGLGKTAGGEGVLGLQRAFQTAGARTTVTSLWKIRDDATRSLMIDFYENLWTKKMSKIEALRQAQLTLMRDGVKRGLDFEADKPPSTDHQLPPYYWAAFVLSGDWR
jgi:CHAT domain-containing protein/Tfp pilus assembly protein PilF